MSEGLELNTIIQETINKNCDDEETLDFIVDCLQYELDIWNRQILHTEIMGKYEFMLERKLRE
jgi:formylmethanofuran:tetrahydromethanopterin formyltransferase